MKFFVGLIFMLLPCISFCRYLNTRALQNNVHDGDNNNYYCNDQTDSKYLYVIYYDDNNCQEAVAIEGFVLGEEQDLNRGNSDDRSATCAQEVICQIDETSLHCEKLKDSSSPGKTTFKLLENGTIRQLDNTNEINEQDIILSKDKCYSSSVHRHCHFKVASLSDIITNNSKLIQNNNSNFNNDYLNDQLYLLFYNDENCIDLAGIDGFVANETKKLLTTNLTISAHDAVACAYNPGGNVCNNDVARNGEISFSGHAVPASGDNYNNVVWCTKNIHDEEICKVISPDECLPSDFHDCNGCRFKVVSGLDLFANPKEITISAYSQPYDFVPCPENDENASNIDNANNNNNDSASLIILFVIIACTILILVLLTIGYRCHYHSDNFDSSIEDSSMAGRSGSPISIGVKETYIDSNSVSSGGRGEAEAQSMDDDDYDDDASMLPQPETGIILFTNQRPTKGSSIQSPLRHIVATTHNDAWREGLTTQSNTGSVISTHQTSTGGSSMRAQPGSATSTSQRSREDSSIRAQPGSATSTSQRSREDSSMRAQPGSATSTSHRSGEGSSMQPQPDSAISTHEIKTKTVLSRQPQHSYANSTNATTRHNNNNNNINASHNNGRASLKKSLDTKRKSEEYMKRQQRAMEKIANSQTKNTTTTNTTPSHRLDVGKQVTTHNHRENDNVSSMTNNTTRSDVQPIKASQQQEESSVVITSSTKQTPTTKGPFMERLSRNNVVSTNIALRRTDKKGKSSGTKTVKSLNAKRKSVEYMKKQQREMDKIANSQTKNTTTTTTTPSRRHDQGEEPLQVKSKYNQDSDLSSRGPQSSNNNVDNNTTPSSAQQEEVPPQEETEGSSVQTGQVVGSVVETEISSVTSPSSHKTKVDSIVSGIVTAVVAVAVDNETTPTRPLPGNHGHTNAGDGQFYTGVSSNSSTVSPTLVVPIDTIPEFQQED